MMSARSQKYLQFLTWCQGKRRITGLFSNHDMYWVSISEAVVIFKLEKYRIPNDEMYLVKVHKIFGPFADYCQFQQLLKSSHTKLRK